MPLTFGDFPSVSGLGAGGQSMVFAPVRQGNFGQGDADRAAFFAGSGVVGGASRSLAGDAVGPALGFGSPASTSQGGFGFGRGAVPSGAVPSDFGGFQHGGLGSSQSIPIGLGLGAAGPSFPGHSALGMSAARSNHDPAMGVLFLLQEVERELSSLQQLIVTYDALVHQSHAGGDPQMIASTAQLLANAKARKTDLETTRLQLSLGNVGGLVGLSPLRVQPRVLTDYDQREFTGFLDQAKAVANLKVGQFVIRLASSGFVAIILSGGDYAIDIPQVRSALLPQTGDFASLVPVTALGSTTVGDSRDITEVAELPIFTDRNLRTFYMGRTVYLSTFVKGGKRPDTIAEVSQAIRSMCLCYRVLLGNTEMSHVFTKFIDAMHRPDLRYVTADFWRVWLEDCLRIAMGFLRGQYSPIAARSACPAAPESLLVRHGDRLVNHSVALMTAMVDTVVPFVDRNHFERIWRQNLESLAKERCLEAYTEAKAVVEKEMPGRGGARGGGREHSGSSMDHAPDASTAKQDQRSGGSGGASGGGPSGSKPRPQPASGRGGGSRGGAGPRDVPRRGGHSPPRGRRQSSPASRRGSSPVRRGAERSRSPVRRGGSAQRGRSPAGRRRSRERDAQRRGSSRSRSRSDSNDRRGHGGREAARRRSSSQDRRPRRDSGRDKRRSESRDRSRDWARQPSGGQSNTNPLQIVCRQAVLHLADRNMAQCAMRPCRYHHPLTLKDVALEKVELLLKTTRLNELERAAIVREYTKIYPSLADTPAPAAAGGAGN